MREYLAGSLSNASRRTCPFTEHERIDGVEVVRLPLYPSHDGSSLRRSLNFLSFFLSALIYCLWRSGRFDLAYVYHPPITVGLAAALAGWARRLPFLLDVQDLWPDTIAVTGMPGAKSLERPIGRGPLTMRACWLKVIAALIKSRKSVADGPSSRPMRATPRHAC
jgi:hypothetical protein